MKELGKSEKQRTYAYGNFQKAVDIFSHPKSRTILALALQL